MPKLPVKPPKTAQQAADELRARLVKEENDKINAASDGFINTGVGSGSSSSTVVSSSTTSATLTTPSTSSILAPTLRPSSQSRSKQHGNNSNSKNKHHNGAVVDSSSNFESSTLHALSISKTTSSLSASSEPFNPTSSSTSTTLSIPSTLSSFIPSSIKSPTTFLGVSDREQSEIMARELREGSYECCVCFDTVALKDGIWACDTCYRIFHVKCAKEWRDRSVKPSASGTSNSASNREPWRCPGCQATQHIVPTDKCFCGKMRSPDFDPYITPHSCGNICGKRRGHGCPHPCADTCHPGPCSPCPAMGPTRSCSCGRVTYRSRCGVPPERDALSNEGGCGAICGKTLRCNVSGHVCTKPCHRGPCEPCNKQVTQSCFCGRNNEERPCGGDINTTIASTLSNSISSSQVILPRSSFLLLGDIGAAGPGIICKDKVIDNKGDEIITSTSIPIEPGVYLTRNLLSSKTSREEIHHSSSSTSFSSDLLSTLLVAVNSTGSFKGLDILAEKTAKTLASSLPLTTVRQERQKMQNIRFDKTQKIVKQLPSLSSSLTKTKTSTLDKGYYSCGKICGAWLDCGLHRCTSTCHTGDCSGCMLLPSRHTTCACGQTSSKEFDTIRTTCLDELSTCQLKCNRSLSCGHECVSLCHNGPCPPCTTLTAISCRCEASTSVLPCNIIYACVASGGDLQTLLRKQHQQKATLVNKSTRSSTGTNSMAMYNSISEVTEESDQQIDLGSNSNSNSSLNSSSDALLSLLPKGSLTISEALRLALPVEAVAATLLHCTRACGRKLSCGRHRCARICCPLGKVDTSSIGDDRAYEEARTDSVMQLAEQVRLILKNEEMKDLHFYQQQSIHDHHHQSIHDHCHHHHQQQQQQQQQQQVILEEGKEGEEEKQVTDQIADEKAISLVYATVVDSLPSNPSGQSSGHTCSRPCGKPLSCGRHMCDNPCHSGPCAECGHVDYTAPLRCACGRTSMPPPVRCGTSLPPCRYPCPIPRPCGHAHAAWHTCHPDSFPCPPCAALTERLCSSGHERRTVPCHISVITCSRPCGRLLPCQDHYCTKPCHLGPCLDESIAMDKENLTIEIGIENGAKAFAEQARKLAIKAWGESNKIIVSQESINFNSNASITVRSINQGARGGGGGGGGGGGVIIDDSAWESGSFVETSLDQTLSRLVDEALHTASSSSSPLDVGILQRNAIQEYKQRHAARLHPRPSCTSKCGKTKRLCHHTCLVPCHPGLECPDLSCTENTIILCACGRLSAQLPCLHGGFASDISKEREMEMDLNSRTIPCDDHCHSTSRARAFGEATGIIDNLMSTSNNNNTISGSQRMSIQSNTSSIRTILSSKVSPFSDALLLFARENKTLAEKTEKSIRDMLLFPEKYNGQGETGAGINLQPMLKANRAFVHQLAEVYGINSTSSGAEPRRYVRLTRRTSNEKAINGPPNRYGSSGSLLKNQQTISVGISSSSSSSSSIGWLESNDSLVDGNKGSITTLSSSIGTFLQPGVLILPSMTLVEAATYFSARLDRLQGSTSTSSGGGLRSNVTSGSSGTTSGTTSGSGNSSLLINRWGSPGGSGVSLISKANSGSLNSTSSSSSSTMGVLPPSVPGSLSVLGPVHPLEPPLSNLGKLVGCTLHAFNVKASTTSRDISNAIGIEGLSVKRLDEHNVLIIHESLGKSTRTMEAYEMSIKRGIVMPFKLRYWGIGVERWIRTTRGNADL
jgi:hypothetical protein